jgi:hypothetical protein
MSTNYGTDIEILVRCVKWLNKCIITILKNTSNAVTWTAHISATAATDSVHWSPASRRGGAGFNPQPVHGGIMADRLGTFVHRARSVPVSIIAPSSHTHLFIYLSIYLSYTLCNFNNNFK